MIDPAARAASIGPVVEVASIGPAVEVDSVIWTARLKTGRVVTFRASVSRAFKAAALIDLEVVGDLGVIALAVEVDLAAIASVAAGDSGAVALAALEDLVGAVLFAAVGSGAGDENKCLEPNF
ncbi:unnamed protein product [uncultured bacterium]|nr:unnamed protein product [uncultured bacterium]